MTWPAAASGMAVEAPLATAVPRTGGPATWRIACAELEAFRARERAEQVAREERGRAKRLRELAAARRLCLTRTGDALVSLLPATATVIGVVVLTQIPSAAEIIGVALVVVGVALHRERATAAACQGR